MTGIRTRRSQSTNGEVAGGASGVDASGIHRREWFKQGGGGLAAIALSDLLAREAVGEQHHRAKAKRVIQLFMTGGASPMDLFDYKPELERLHGQMLGPKDKPEGFTAPAGAIMKSPFAFSQHGDSGRWVSELFPEQAKLVDEMAFLMAMTTKTNVHGPGTYMMNSGFLLPGFPCLGAWVSYAKVPIPDLYPDAKYSFAQGASDIEGQSLLRWLNEQYGEGKVGDSRLDARLAGYELAAKMQLSAPEAFDLGSETTQCHKDYGIDKPVTEDFGRRCLLARRLIERGVRFCQVWSGPQGATNNWDNHGNIQTELPPMTQSVDQPIAALLRDLKARGLDKDTLVIWTTEFGRTPFAQGSLGRDHNGGSFVTWLWGAGVKEGVSYGQSDDWGYQAIENKTWCYDLHATILHLLGIDHTRLVVRHNGIDRRLTDVHGHVIQEVLS